ncbi:MAG: hypothetical protein A2Z47_08290 [Thermodesulfovibrio sp. RBG_19FT_COMBO_42_12]|nr:MAG: hypothetical protein A2Z47_08290 [Thermodesulfovibrio sp. RBG_19FT_COMBO_42_12]
MKISIRKMIVLLAVVLSLIAVQAVWASTLTITGTIERIGTDVTGSIDVLSGDTIYTFYDIPFTDLATQGIVLAVGDSVTVGAYVVTFPNGTVKNIAYSITKGDTTYTWHPNIPKAGTEMGALSTTATAATGCICDNCYCNCPEDCIDCPCDCLCDCTCDGTGPNGPKK